MEQEYYTQQGNHQSNRLILNNMQDYNFQKYNGNKKPSIIVPNSNIRLDKIRLIEKINNDFREKGLNTFFEREIELSKVLEMRQPTLYKKALTTSKYMKEFAKHLGVTDPNKLEAYKWGGKMYDIGVAISTAPIHVEYGRMLLGSTLMPSEMMDMIKYHHHLYTGKEDQKLKNENIPYAGRMAAIIDYFFTNIFKEQDPLTPKSSLLSMITVKNRKIFDPILLREFAMMLKPFILQNEKNVSQYQIQDGQNKTFENIIENFYFSDPVKDFEKGELPYGFRMLNNGGRKFRTNSGDTITLNKIGEKVANSETKYSSTTYKM